MSKISIIVPIYNTEKYIENCLNSLINQTYKNIEIICINDGSQDNSLNILKDYANKDNRIIIIDKQNEGVSVARNIGIQRATGDYIMVVDSDDTIELNACKVLFDTFIKHPSVDIIYYQCNRINENKKNKLSIFKYNELKNKPIRFFDKSEIFNFLYIGTAYICKANFIKSNNIKYPEHISTAEDYIFHIKMLYLNPIVMVIDKYLYNYYDRKNSLSKVGAFKYLNSYLNDHINNYLPKIFKNKLSSEEIKFKKVVYNYYLVNILRLWIDLYFTEYKNQYIKILDEVVNGNKELSISKDDVKKMSNYHLYIKFKILSILHLGYIYAKIFRPVIRKIHEMVINNAK